MSALVISSSNNIFRVRMEDGRLLECRLKGKVLKGMEGFYNPLASGDLVEVEEEGSSSGTALITALAERRNVYSRWNQKGKAPQLLAANLDLLLCVSSVDNPPFRPRFIDRVLLQADIAGIPAAIVLNKVDLGDDDPDLAERIEDFIRIGFPVLQVSAAAGIGIPELRALVVGKRTALVGQSGVGKSSLLNALDPSRGLRTGAVSMKFDRGRHTTTMANLFASEGSPGWIVDTPGLRCIVPDGISAGEVASHLCEFAPLVGTCTYGASCTHISEPGCKILEAVAAGHIHEDRYESYLNLRDELLERGPAWKQR